MKKNDFLIRSQILFTFLLLNFSFTAFAQVGVNNLSLASDMLRITPENVAMNGLVSDVRIGASTSTLVVDNGTITNNTSDAVVGISSNNAYYGGGYFVNITTQSGTGYGTATMGYGVLGTSFGIGDYRTGVFGSVSYPTGVNAARSNRRTAGVFGSNSETSGATSTNTIWGALGYNTSDYNPLRYGGYFYNYNTGIDHTDGNGRLDDTSNSGNIAIGIGAVGDYMSAALRGRKYGLSTSGKEFGIYIDGTAFSNKHYIQLNKSDNNTIIPTYVSTSTTLDVTTKGRSTLNGGSTRIQFNKDFKGLDIKEEEIIITITPLGESNGLYITNVDKTGFTVKENSGGTSNVNFNWIAIASISKDENLIPRELLTNEFEETLKNILKDEDEDVSHKAKTLDIKKE
jgi:hypothetical protein